MFCDAPLIASGDGILAGPEAHNDTAKASPADLDRSKLAAISAFLFPPSTTMSKIYHGRSAHKYVV